MATQTPPPPAQRPTDPNRPSSLPEKLNSANVASFLMSDGIRKQIALALPQHLKAERMIRMALTTVRRTPKLLDCDPMSLVAGIVQASELGLELSGPLGQAYLIPRNVGKRMEATFQIGYRGFLRLAYNSGQVAFFNARAVRDGDYFDYNLGTEQFIKHKTQAQRGAKITHFYGVLQQKDGAGDCEVWSLADMEEHRDRFRSDKSLKERNKGYRGPWDTDFEAMGCKTLIRELSKRAPLSAELMSQASRDEYVEYGFNPMFSAAEIAPPMIESNSDEPKASLDLLDEIDAEITRAGIQGNQAQEMMDRFIQGDGELTEESAKRLLAELRRMPDAGG